MDPLTLGLTVGGALFGGITNLLGASEEEKQYKRRKDEANKILERNLIDEGELNLMLNNTERLFNNRLTSTLNSTALRTRGVANANVVGAAVAGSMESNKLETLQNQRSQVMQSNIRTNTQIAENEMNTPVTNTTAAFVSGTLGGAQMGMAAGNFISSMGKVDKIDELTTKENGSPSVQDSIAAKFGPDGETVSDNSIQEWWKNQNRKKSTWNQGPMDYTVAQQMWRYN